MRTQTQAIAAKARIRKNNEERITRAAMIVFASKGAHGTTIAEIAECVKMPTATIHYYFRNKEALYDAVLQQIVELWLSKIASIEDSESPLQEIENYVRSKMEFSRSYPEASRIFATDILGGHSNILRQIETDIRSIVIRKCKLIGKWIKKGDIRPTDPLNLFFAIWGMTEYYANFASEIGVFFDGKPLTEQQYETSVKTVVELVVNGLRPTGSRQFFAA
jgi:TetR/AcrR family transcriptional regulator